jgi:PAS domain S-box-containing protein
VTFPEASTVRRRIAILSRLRLRPKIAIAVGGVFLLSTAILATVAVSDVGSLWNYLESSQQDTVRPYQQAEEINDALERMEMALLGGIGGIPSAWQARQQVIDHERRLVADGVARYEGKLTLGSQPEMRDLLQKYGVLDEHVSREQNALRVLNADLSQLTGVAETVSRLVGRGESGAARAAFDAGAAPLFEQTIGATSVLMAMQLEESGYAALAGRAVMQRTARSIVLTIVMTLLLTLVTTYWLTHHITSPLRALVHATQAVERGDLSRSVAVTTQDEIGALGTAFNYMTASVRAERDRSQRYLDTAAVFLLALDPEGRITLVNRYACSVLGWTADELHGRSWVDTCIPPSLRNTLNTRFHSVIGGDLAVLENPVLTKSGEERLIEWHNTLLRNNEGQVIGTFSSGLDITQRNRAQVALMAAEERTRFALEAARVGIWDLDCATGVLEWSEILESQYGLEPGSFGGTFEAFVALVHPEDRDALRLTFAQASQSGGDCTLSHRTRLPDGSVRWISGVGRIRRDTEGKPARGVGISLDVTDLRIEQLRVLRMTMLTVQDIVSNALMSLYAFREEAEPHVSTRALKLFDHIIGDTAQRLQAIGNLENVAEKPMVIGIGIDYPIPPPTGKV